MYDWHVYQNLEIFPQYATTLGPYSSRVVESDIVGKHFQLYSVHHSSECRYKPNQGGVPEVTGPYLTPYCTVKV